MREIKAGALHQPLGRAMVMVLQAVLVTNNLTVEFVNQFINGRVEVFVRTFGKHIAALDMDVALGTLPSLLFLLFLDGEEYLDIDDLVEMPHDSI